MEKDVIVEATSCIDIDAKEYLGIIKAILLNT